MKFKLFKDRKGKADQAKNNKFVKLGREIYVQARKGGPNPDANFGLKTAIANARQINMPVDNIERAIKKAAGNGDNVEYDEIYYEGYGPGGVAIMVKCLTDNRNRTAADVRSIFNKRGGNMGESGCVSYMFDQKGLLVIDREKFEDLDEDTLMLQAIEAGADDVITNEESFEVITHPHEFEAIKSVLEEAELVFSSSEVRWIPQNTIEVEGENAEKLLRMMDLFEDNDDVQDVYTNFEISEAEIERIG
ncbi:transcriptional regulator [Paenibacillus macquariensis subsp. defensor]|uniref:Probable transcriptional regulatory protein SAMN05421578_105308 n=1 Tax=Paenibacillus macquariensis TaxID=948756 RepID=A0ABY1JYA7_9BACL|nr:YebC/PmpR family DNA-binding transcriptional regulator [Paenibacillus macquariensis]MEC0089151.1 YebC/PmpR family DNA-binding transcriptional regulator [Paenibacillus macquariensis]OAB33428.1 transcriptional regulator [Paenibacillus macquariensis subsp. macquariensis]OAB39882.1 transcriptional regulator [Paenibacillus macquariensis subsp. defensor]SIQ97641.1 DNA-binding regulatory protein, YebC/PmpR family [Paenibacillus macquariensis]